MKIRMRWVPLVLTFLASTLGVAAGSVSAQSYPSRIIRVINPNQPGGNSDIVFRRTAAKMGEILGQQMVFDYRPGAGGNIGADLVAKSAPDGYTTLIAAASFLINPSMIKNLPFDAIKDFTPLGLVVEIPASVVVHPSLGTKNIKELIALAKARPGQLNFASTGIGGTNHLSGELFKSMAGIDIVHVPYKGTSTAVPDLIGGQVSMMFTATLSALPHVKTGLLRALGITSLKRSPAAPELPTIAESGLPGYESVTWFALLAPTGTSREIVTRLNATITKIWQMPEIRDRLLSQGAEPLGGTPEQLGAFIKSEITKWSKVVAASGARAE